jgi:hypothetical protein
MTDDNQREDARFEDGAERPLRLAAETPEDLAVMSALLQDAVTSRGDMAWMPKRRRFTAVLNRFRWEDAPAAERQGRHFERVRALLDVGNVLRVRSDGIDPGDRATILSLLSIGFDAGADAAGTLRLIFAGDGEVALDVECVDLRLADVTKPYLAHAGTAPVHPVE